MNTYSKYCPNVFLAKCEEKHEKGEIITVETKYGKENESIVHNLIYEDDEAYYYSITRADGFDIQERARRKAEKYERWAGSRMRKSDEYFEASQEGKDFLSLGEPIKVGHHSERRHRALIERNYNRMRKSVENSKKAEKHASKSEYWANKVDEVNLSMPESLEYYTFKLEEAEKLHKFYKENPDKREHSFSLTYAKKDVNNFKKKLKTAQILWK